MPGDEDVTRAATAPVQLKDGWGRIHIGYGRAFAYATGGYKGTVLWAVIEQAWCVGWFQKRPDDPVPEPEPCRLNCGELARATGLRRVKLNEAKQQLIADGLLEELPDGRVLPSKHYDLWSAALPPAIIAYCQAGSEFMASTRTVGPSRTPKRVPVGTPKGVQDPANGTPKGVQDHAAGTPKGVQGGTPKGVQAQTNGTPKGVQVPPIGTPKGVQGAAPNRNLDLIQTTPHHTARASGAVVVVADPPDRLTKTTPRPAVAEIPLEPLPRPAAVVPVDPLWTPPTYYEQAVEEIGDVMPGDVVPDEAVLAKVHAAVNSWFAMEDTLHRQVERFKRQFPSPWYIKAFKRVKLDERRPRSTWRVVFAILREWKLSPDGPNRGPEDDYDDRLQLIPPSQKKESRHGRPESAPSPPRYIEATPEQLARYAGRPPRDPQRPATPAKPGRGDGNAGVDVA